MTPQKAQRSELLSNMAMTGAMLVFLASDLASLIQHHHSHWTLPRLILEAVLIAFYGRRMLGANHTNPETLEGNRTQ